MPKKKYNRLKVVLVEKETTNRDLAKYLKKNESTVSLWCNNERQPSIKTLFEIAEYLKVEPRELLVTVL